MRPLLPADSASLSQTPAAHQPYRLLWIAGWNHRRTWPDTLLPGAFSWRYGTYLSYLRSPDRSHTHDLLLLSRRASHNAEADRIRHSSLSHLARGLHARRDHPSSWAWPRHHR